MNQVKVTKRVQKQLFELQDLQYRDFQAKLLPTIEKETIIGVRIPVLRKFAKGYGKTEEAKELLRNNKRAAFSVNGDNGYPYAIPINFYYDEEENKIYFHSAKKGHKIDSIKKNDKVCLTTWNDGYVDDGDWAYHVSSCVIFGRARLVDDIRITEEKIRKFALKYYPSAEEVEEEIKMGIKGVQLVEIEIEHISGKKVHER